MRILDNQFLDFDDVLILPKISELKSRKDVDITRKFKFKYSSHKWIGTPIIAANMSTVATFKMAKALNKYNILTAIHKHYPAESLIKFFNSKHSKNSFYSMGLRDEDLVKMNYVKKRLNNELKMICIDVPSAYLTSFIDHVKLIREQNPNAIIMAGNCVTAEMTETLILSGTDMVKVGIGSGSGCLTRKVAGVGSPQLTSVIQCVDAAHGLGGQIVSDGGIVYTGDLGKAYGAGADFVMLGSKLAGCKENTDAIIEKDGEQFAEFYGMSSHKAQEKFQGGVKNYRGSEGRELLIPYKGKVEYIVYELLAGLRSTMTYIGANSIKEIPKRTTFITVNNQLNNSLSRYE